MRRKILFLDQFGSKGGGQQVLLDTLGALNPEQFDPTVALNGDGAFRTFLQSRGTQVIDLPLGSYHSRRKTMGDMARFGQRTVRCSLRLASSIVRNHFDLVFANGPRTFACGALAGRLTGRPVIWHLHNVLPSKMAAALSLMTPWVSQLIACSRAAAEPLLERRSSLQSKIRLIHNPVPDWPETPQSGRAVTNLSGHGEGVVSFGLLGRVTPFKGQAQFVQAAHLVLQRSKKVRFFIIGSPAPDDAEDSVYFLELKAHVKSSGIASHVHLVDEVTDVRSYYSLLDIVVLASQGKEAAPRTLIEAMYLGKPVIAPSHGGISEIVRDGETGLLLPSAEPPLLADRMLELLNDPARRSVLGAAAKKDVIARFSRNVFRRKMNKVLNNCFEPRSKGLEHRIDPAAVAER